MRSKTILSAATFVLAFVFSSAFANLFNNESVRISEPDELLVSQSDWRMQRQMLEFLEQDRRYGREFARDLAGSITENEPRQIEEKATFNLVNKMRRMDDSAMPLDFRAAWENHVQAWEDQADFIYSNRLQSRGFGKGYTERNSEINRTYDVLLGVAWQHGVDFPN